MHTVNLLNQKRSKEASQNFYHSQNTTAMKELIVFQTHKSLTEKKKKSTELTTPLTQSSSFN